MILSERFNYPDSFYEKSIYTLETALSTAPAYKPWASLDPGPAASVDERYEAMPELTKQIIRDHFPTGLAPNHADIEAGLLNDEIEYTYTSGTTGDRVINIWSQSWWNASEKASRKLNANTAGLPYPCETAKLASSLNVGISCEEDLPMSSRLVGETLYLNEKINLIQWQSRHYKRIINELNDFKPVILEANPSLLARVAYFATDNGLELYSPDAIIFTYEFESAIHLDAIRSVFSSPLISSFGTTETGFVLQSCDKGLLHQNTDFCRIDFHPLKDEYGGPELGRILVTTFDNQWNTVIKFDTGDLVRLHPSGACACGIHEGFIADRIEGRVGNSTFSVSGGLVTTYATDRALYPISGIRDYNLEQRGSREYELLLMVAGDHGSARESILGQARMALEALYGEGGEFDVKIMTNILPGPAGKFRRTSASFDFDTGRLFV